MHYNVFGNCDKRKSKFYSQNLKFFNEIENY